MPRDEHDRLLREIAGGGSPVGAEAADARQSAEQHVTESILNRYGGILLFGDTVHQFYSDTLRAFSPQLSSATSQLDQFSLHWHIIALTRFYTSFDLLKRGYYFESIALTRSVWEIALTLAGLKRNVVQLEQLFGGRTEEGGVRSDSRRVVRRVREADEKIQQHLLWRNAALDEHDKEKLNVFYHLLNQSNHKGNLGLSANIGRQTEGQLIAVFPEFSEHVTLSWNLLFVATWCVTVTLSYIRSLHPPAESSWHDRYSKLLRICEYTSEHSPSDVVRGFSSIAEKIFRITSAT